MTDQTTTVDIDSFDNEVEFHGAYAGYPTVKLRVGIPDKTATVQTIVNQFESYNWRRKIQNGTRVLKFTSHDTSKGRPTDPLDKRHVDMYAPLYRVFRPRHTVLKTKYISVPHPRIDQYIDRYIVELTMDRCSKYLANDREGMHWFSNREERKEIHYHVYTSERGGGDTLEEFSRHFSLNDDNIWLIPEGDTLEEVSRSYRELYDYEKGNGWKVSPRLDIVKAGPPDDEDETDS